MMQIVILIELTFILYGNALNLNGYFSQVKNIMASNTAQQYLYDTFKSPKKFQCLNTCNKDAECASCTYSDSIKQCNLFNYYINFTTSNLQSDLNLYTKICKFYLLLLIFIKTVKFLFKAIFLPIFQVKVEN